MRTNTSRPMELSIGTLGWRHSNSRVASKKLKPYESLTGAPLGGPLSNFCLKKCLLCHTRHPAVENRELRGRQILIDVNTDAESRADVNYSCRKLDFFDSVRSLIE